VKYVLDMMVVLTWLGMSLAVVSLVGHYRMIVMFGLNRLVG
jgi:hypothetical protein